VKEHTEKWAMKAVAALSIVCTLILLVGCQGVSSGATGGGQSQAGELSLSSSSLNFGSVAAGNSKSLAISATNTGTTSITISAAMISTPYFAITTPSLPISIGAGQSATLTLTFTPNAAGSFNATATVTSNASNAQANVSLSGTGTSTATAGQLAVTPTTFNLGNVIVGTSGGASGTLTASGANVTITAAGTNNSVFTVGGLPLPATIAAGQSASFSVTFSPTVTGTANATLSFTSNAQSPTTTAMLAGTGAAAPVHSVNLSWNASTSSNIAGYNVYRAVYASSCGSFSKINSLLDTGTLYTDSNVVDGTAYCYATTAINTSSQESGYSNVVSNVQIPAP
jgi:hypothetical protein